MKLFFSNTNSPASFPGTFVQLVNLFAALSIISGSWSFFCADFSRTSFVACTWNSRKYNLLRWYSTDVIWQQEGLHHELKANHTDMTASNDYVRPIYTWPEIIQKQNFTVLVIGPQLKKQKKKENKPDSQETNYLKMIQMKLEFLFETALFAPWYYIWYLLTHQQRILDNYIDQALSRWGDKKR